MGTATQVDLAACLEDKTTCNAQDASEAPWNPGTWLSAVRYATHAQTSVAPGQIGTFRYTVTAPANAAAGTYRFNGDLVLSITGERIHPQGYFQDATISTSAQAATITSITPSNTGSVAGGQTRQINGSNIVCQPAFPTVRFGTNAATVTACGASQVTVTTPAGAAGTVDVTVTNAGAGPSNALPFTYRDETRPTYGSVAVAGNVATVTFDEPVCRSAGWATTHWEITVNGVDAPDSADSAPICNATSSNAVNSFNVFFAPAAPNGAFVAVTLTAAGGATIRDAANNFANAPRTNTATATAPETTPPTITSASGTGGSATLRVNFSEPVWCNGVTGGEFVVTATGQPTRTGTATTCPTSAQTAASTFTVTLNGTLASNVTYTLTYTDTVAGTPEIRDVQGNALASPATTAFTSSAADTTPPTLTDTRATANVGTTDFDEDGDTFTITFSETMSTASGSITFTDGDGTSATATCGTNALCSWNAAATTVTVEITVNLVPVETTTSTPGIQLPATITTMSGFSDASNNVPNLAASADRIIDFE
ncbi:MAG: IPT/TIG domain-containing protein [Thermoleophilaceae bacterium]